jgi:hypothetical protein
VLRVAENDRLTLVSSSIGECSPGCLGVGTGGLGPGNGSSNNGDENNGESKAGAKLSHAIVHDYYPLTANSLVGLESRWQPLCSALLLIIGRKRQPAAGPRHVR